MEPRSAPSDAATNVVPLRVAGELPVPIEELVEQALRIAVGIAAVTVDTLADAVARSVGGSPTGEGAIPRSAPSGIPVAAGAAMGAAVSMTRWAARATTTLLRTGELVLSPITTSVPYRDGMRYLRTELDALDARWRRERTREEEAAQAFVRALVPQVVEAALDQVDIDAIVAERVDIEQIIERVDLDAVVARVDIVAVIDRLDMSALIDKIPLDEVVSRIDVDGIVAQVDLDRVVDRIDLDAVASRLDVEAVVRRLDLNALALEVVDAINLTEIVREAVGSMTSETVGGIRVQSMNADRAISRLVARVLQRREEAEAAEAADAAADADAPGGREDRA